MPVDLLVLGAALLTGLLGGVHCIAMCGGIATGLAATSPKPGLGTAFALNGGRVLGYTIAGALVGAFGGGLLLLARSEALATGLPQFRTQFEGVTYQFARLSLGTAMLMVANRPPIKPLLKIVKFRFPSSLGSCSCSLPLRSSTGNHF